MRAELELAGTELRDLEGVIERGLTTFIEVGQALLTIRDGRLYREAGYGNFDDYCRERWRWSRQQSDRLIQGAEVISVLTPIGVTPRNEAQARELAPLLGQPNALREAWNEARTQHGDGVTAADVREVVQRQIAPLAVHFSSDSPEWYTPRHIIDRVLAALGAIDLDPCSNPGPYPNVPAARHFTEADNGLAQPWFGRVYLNPPYGDDIRDWIERLCAAHEAGHVPAAVALVPARTDTAWWARLSAYPVCFVRGRLKFSGHDNAAPFPSAVVYLGPEMGAFLRAFGDVGAVYRRVGGG